MSEVGQWPTAPFVEVVGRVGRISDDGTDSDSNPDWSPDAGVEVTLTPSITGVIVYDALGSDPIIVRVQSVKCITDEQGRLVSPSTGVPVKILATDDPLLSITGWTWTATASVGWKVVFAAPSSNPIVKLSDFIAAPANDAATQALVGRIPEMLETVQTLGSTITDAATTAVAASKAAESAKEAVESFGFTATAEHVSSDTPISVEVTGTAPTFNLDFDIPRGRDAYIESATPPTDTSMLWLDTSTPSLPESGSPFELRGYGMPEGVVTASPGIYYTDNVGTNGAWRWLKTSGTGNTGWTVIHGDTGWRNVTDLTTDPTAFYVWMKRTGNEVVTYVSVVASPASGQIIAAPDGFRPGANPWGGNHATAAPVGVVGRMGGGQTILYFGNPESGPNTLIGEGVSTYKRGYARWTTMNAWPTTLPGTAV